LPVCASSRNGFCPLILSALQLVVGRTPPEAGTSSDNSTSSLIEAQRIIDEANASIAQFDESFANDDSNFLDHDLNDAQGEDRDRGASNTPSRTPAERIDVPPLVNVSINFRAGDPQAHTRPRKGLPQPVDVVHTMNNLGFELLMTTIRHHAGKIKNFEMHPDPYLQPANTSTSKQYRRLDSASCNSNISAAYIKEARRLRKEARTHGNSIDDISVKLNIFVYLKEAAPAAGAAVIGRASKKGIQEELTLIDKDPALSHLGPAQRQYLATTEARKRGKDPSDPIVVPTNHTFRQLGQIDQQYSELEQRTEEEQRLRNQRYRKVPIRIGDQKLFIEVHVSALLEALGLPDVRYKRLGQVRRLPSSDGHVNQEQQQELNGAEPQALPQIDTDEDTEDGDHMTDEEFEDCEEQDDDLQVT